MHACRSTLEDPTDEVRKRYATTPTGTEWPDLTLAGIDTASRIHLDAVYPSIQPNTFVVLATPDDEPALFLAGKVVASSRSGFALSAKTTRIEPKGDGLLTFNDRVRVAVVFAAPEGLKLAERPWTDPIKDDTILLDRAVADLLPGRLLLVRGVVHGDASKTKSGELTVLKEAVPQNGRTLLRLIKKLGKDYDRTTATVAGNVALGTHGEGVSQVLGGGDAGVPYQRFGLRESPLTYTTADTPSGTQTTLEVRVNDIRWDEVPTLFGRGPQERVYVARRDDDGKTAVLFGDGRTGARVPSGRDNVRAAYRKGIGRDGMVRAEQLSLLMTRPLGVKGVVNPLPAEGAQDPQQLADARRNAPFTVLTLDRVLSLRDYEDFARAFAGVAKSKVAWTWAGHTRGVFVTVAGPDGAPLAGDGPTITRLVSALQANGDPRVPVRVASYRKAHFALNTTVRRDPAYLADFVRAGVVAALKDRFGFEAREFGQAVTLSEVVAVIQNVPGVASVNVTRLYRTGVSTAAELHTYLPADAPADGSADNGTLPDAAELLTLADDVADAIEVVP